MAIKITQSNKTGFSAVPADELNFIIDGETGVVPDTYMPTVYEAIPFSIDLYFQGKYADPLDPLVYTYADATNNSSTYNWAALGLTYTKLTNSTCRISGSHQNPFPDQFYRFVLPDLSLVVLPGNTTTEFYSLEKYQMPSPVSVMKSMTISVTIPPDPTLGTGGGVQTVTMDQWVHWSYPSAVAAIAAARARGIR
jgi:hypothetical protein